jgi:hypothetical protein
LALGGAITVALATVLMGAGTMRPARASAPELPNLVADPPDNIEQVISGSGGSAHLLLRFNGYVHNRGPGALDFRGERSAPKVAGHSEAEVNEAVEEYKQREESLPPKIEEELAKPKMSLQQREFFTNAGNPAESEKYMNREHAQVPSSGEMFYVNADGHHHWHLQHVARYSLWNSAKSGEVAPAQKVGFCLEDSQRVENTGPTTPVYADSVPPFRDFCQQFRPNATSVYEGISPGWRDVYDKNLALQWVDISNVLPGDYFLREDVDPEGIVNETGGGEKVAYSAKYTIAGFDALPQSPASNGAEKKITLGAQAFPSWNTHARRYTIVAPPSHGVLLGVNREGRVETGSVAYRPNGSYAGPDSFTFAAAEENNMFPRSPAVATVSITGETPSVVVNGAQARMVEGASVTLAAAVSGDGGPVEWTASGGSLSATEGRSVVFHAPQQAETVAITARLRDDRDVAGRAVIDVVAPGTIGGAPEVPAQPSAAGNGGSAGLLGTHAGAPVPRVERPRVMLFGRELVMSTSSTVAGRLRLSAYLGTHRLGTCVVPTPGSRAFTCRLRLARSVSLRSRIAVVASLRLGQLVLATRLRAQQIPQMRMRPVGFRAAGAASRTVPVYWCSPSTLAPVLALSSRG